MNFRASHLLVLLLPVASLFAAENKVVSFSALPATDTLVIRYEWLSCWSFLRAEFTFDPGDHGSFEVEELLPPARQTVKGPEWKHHRLGSITLEPGEKAKLDRLLAACRTTEFDSPIQVSVNLLLTLTQLRGGKVIAEEKLSPSPLLAQASDDILTFSEMLRALKAPR